MFRAALTIAAMLLFLGGVGQARADIIAYDNASVTPNQLFGNTLGMDFDVSQTITVTSLGAFFGDNINNLTFQNPAGVTVGIFDSTSQTLVGSSVTISPSNFNTLVNGDAFINIGTPIVLAAGFQGTIVALNDPNYNSNGGANPTSTLSDGGGAISFVGGGSYSFNNASLAYPTTPDAGPANRYDAGTFTFIVGVPEPSSFLLFGLAGVFGCGCYFRQRRQVVLS